MPKLIAPAPLDIRTRYHPGLPPDEASIYACPGCKSSLQTRDGELWCPACTASYPVVEGIPDFLAEEYQARGATARMLRVMDRAGWMARLYETPLWYTPVLRLYGGSSAPSFQQCIDLMRDLMDVREGTLLDAACGPATWGRRVASEWLAVYGVDLSWAMLRQGARRAHQGGAANVHLAHGKVEALPFHDATFNAAYCGGALHLFPDTAEALREIGRTLKPGAPLVVLTFLWGKQGVLKFRRQFEARAQARHLHVFEIDEVAQLLGETGFTDYQPQPRGSILFFRARKAG